MLDRFYVNPVLPAQDGDRARAFYADVLGLTLVSGPTADPMMFEAAAGTSTVLTELPDRQPTGYPVVSFMVSDIEQLVTDLLARGATFHDPGTARGTFQGRVGRADGIITDYGPVRTAVVIDSEGNMLALNQIDM